MEDHFEVKKKKKRPVVSYINGNMHDEHSRRLLSGIYRGLLKEDVDFHYYLSAEFYGSLDEKQKEGLRAENHYYSLFSYMALDEPDIILLCMGGLSNAEDAVGVEELVSVLPRVPIILMENESRLPDTTHILIDNYGGMRSLMDHLIKDHGYKRIAFLSGPANNTCSKTRKRAYEDALRSYHLPLSQELMQEGDFHEDVIAQADALLDQKPQALVSANDVMAETCYVRARARGLAVGRDISITGFDDMVTAPYMNPSLTTVEQNYGELVEAVVSQVRTYLSGGELRDVIIPAKLIIRCSCGCRVPVRTYDRVLEEHRTMNRMRLNSVEAALVLRNMLVKDLDIESTLRGVGEVLSHLGAKRSCILLHEHPLLRTRKELVPSTQEILLRMTQVIDRVETYSEKEAPRIHRGGLRESLGLTKKAYLTDFVLFYQDYEYGVLQVEINPADLLFFYSLSLEIGSGLRYFQIAMDRQAIRQSLEEKNQILGYAASHDPLTGLYNRAGIMDGLFRFVRNYQEGEKFLLVMADLDHLKQINDTFGHAEGDVAIQQTSSILREAFSEDSIIGRNGGDEFLAILHLEEESSAPDLMERIHSLCREYNDRVDKPYYLGISAGYHIFTSEHLGCILEVIKEADRMLYEAKKNRISCVVK